MNPPTAPTRLLSITVNNIYKSNLQQQSTKLRMKQHKIEHKHAYQQYLSSIEYSQPLPQSQVNQSSAYHHLSSPTKRTIQQRDPRYY
mmetsp:Transcript_734/g.1104  ORF Transcript_734/g.1104 Transcript_734/m.1104 type:complete len:87 (-) Transcript_734:922-1182(-)